MTTYDLQFRELDSYDINIGDRATRLRRTKTACVSYLKAYRDVQVDAFSEKGIVSGDRSLADPTAIARYGVRGTYSQ